MTVIYLKEEELKLVDIEPRVENEGLNKILFPDLAKRKGPRWRFPAWVFSLRTKDYFKTYQRIVWGRPKVKDLELYLVDREEYIQGPVAQSG